MSGVQSNAFRAVLPRIKSSFGTRRELRTHSDQTIHIHTDAAEQRRAVTSMSLFTDLNQSYRHVLSERRSLFVSHVGYSRGTRPPFFNLYKEMAISKQSTLSVSRGYPLFVHRGTIQIPSAGPLNPTSKLTHLITTNAITAIGFSSEMATLTSPCIRKLLLFLSAGA